MEKNGDIKNKGLKLTVIVLIIMGLFFLREDSLSNIVSKFKFLSVREMSLEYINNVKTEEDEMTNLYNERILNWNGKSLSVLSLDGVPLISKDFQFENPDILFGKEEVYIMDRSLGNIYILNENGETKEKIQTEKGIFNLKEESDKLVIHTKFEDKEGIIFLDNKGKELAKNIELKNILTYSMDEKTSKYLISNISMEDGMETYVSIYNLEGSLEKAISFPGEIVLFTEFIANKQLVLTNLNLYVIDGGEIIFEKQYPFIKDIKIIGGEIYILYDSNLEILNFQGEVQEKFVFPKEYNDIFVYKDLGILYGSHDILGIKKGKTVLEYEMQEEVKDIFGNGDLIGIRLIDTIDLYHLKNKK